jgi:hypothetical protein
VATHEDTLRVLEIAADYLSPNDLLALTRRVYFEIGRPSQDPAIFDLTEAFFVEAGRRASTSSHRHRRRITFHWVALWLLLMLGHITFWGFNLVADYLVTVHYPWYVAMPPISLSVYLLITGVPCPLTEWENWLRRKIGWPIIGSFGWHYLFGPIHRAYKWLQ